MPSKFRFTAEMFADMGLRHRDSGGCGPSPEDVAYEAQRHLDWHVAGLTEVFGNPEAMPPEWMGTRTQFDTHKARLWDPEEIGGGGE